MKLKRTLAAVLATAIIMSMAACGQKDAGNETNGNNNDSAEVTTYKIFRNASYIQGYAEDGGEGKKIILQKLAEAGIKNVDFEVMIGGGDEYYTKINAFAASDNLPDFFNVDFPTMTKFADQGLIVELEEVMKNNAPNLIKLQRESDLNAIKYNGKLYAVPPGYRPESFNGPTVYGLGYRKDWVQKLGLTEPKTLDEMHTLLKAFTEQDPDGNGANDTTGLSVWIENDVVMGLDPIYSAFGIIPNFWYENNGRLQQGSTMPQIKEALKLLSQWYSEGIIDKDYPVAQRTQVEEKFINSKAGMAYLSALDINTKTPVPAALKAAKPDAVMAMAIPPKGANGAGGYAEAQPGYGDLRAVSASTKDPDTLMKIINWSVDDSEKGGFYLVTYGIEGTDYTHDKEKNRIKMLSDYNTLYKKGYSNPVRFAQVVDRRWLDNDDAYAALEITNGNAVTNKFWSTVPAMLEYADTLQLWLEYSTKIITGQLPLEAYDDFVKKYYDQGGKLIEDQVNEAYAKLK